jgi:hypothetical protein
MTLAGMIDLKENNLPGDFRGELFGHSEQRQFQVPEPIKCEPKKIKFELYPNDVSMVLQAIADKVSQLERYRFEKPQTEDTQCSLIGEMGAYNRIFRNIVESLGDREEQK